MDKLKIAALLIGILTIGLCVGCTQLDPYPEDAYFGDIYSNNVLIVPGGAPHDILSLTHSDSTIAAVTRGDLITGQGVAPTWSALALGAAGEYLQSDGNDAVWGALVELDPIFGGSPASGITALDIAGWNGIIASQWTSDANGITYGAGNVGINTPSAVADKLYVYSNAGGATQTALHVAENSASAGSFGINLAVLGAKTGATYGEYVYNAASSNTNAINKYGIYIRSESNWTGAGSTNYGLYIQEPTGGTSNYSIYSSGGANYLGGALSLGTPLTVLNGGTGLVTVADGSILAANAADTLSAITWHAAGTKVLTNTSGTISWETATSPGMTNPMTTLGDIIYEDGTPAPARLAGDTSNTRKFLRTLSVAGVAQAPAWDTLTSTDVGLGSVENTALSTWAGSANITTLGSISTGSWHGTTIAPEHGGTGVSNNAANTLTFTGNYSLGLTLTGNTSLTLPTSGTLAAIGNGCVLDLNGQEGTGSTISDISGQNNHGTITGATWVKLPSGLWVNSFDGTDDYINCGSSTSLDSMGRTGSYTFTVMAWIKPISPGEGNAGHILAKYTPGSSGWNIRMAGNTLHFQIKSGAATKSADSGSVTYDNWHFVVGQYDGTNVKCVLDNVWTTGAAATGIIDDNTANDFTVGNNLGTDYTFAGAIALPRAFSRALSASEISAIYNEEKQLFEQPTIVSGEIRTASGSLTAGNANAMFFAWHNPELQDIYIKKVVINVGTGGGTVGSLGTVGIADDASYTNGGTEFFTALTLNNVAVYDSWLAGDTGAQTKWVFCQDSASATDGWVVGKITVQNAASLVGNYYIEYTGK